MSRDDRVERARLAHERRQAIAAPVVLAIAVAVVSVALSYPLWFFSIRAPRVYTAAVVLGGLVLVVHGIRKRAGAHR